MGSEKNLDVVIVYKKHSLIVRWTHWVHFPLICLMIVSGFMIYWADRVYTPFIPAGFFETINIDHKLALGLSMHFLFMWFFIVNGLIYILYLLFTGEWREIIPRRSGAQKLAYWGITLLGFLQILTGLAIYKPVQLQLLLTLFGNYETARLVHFVVTLLFVLFFCVHIVQVIRSGWSNFRAMVTGIEEVDK